MKPFDANSKQTLDGRLTSKTPQAFEEDFRSLIDNDRYPGSIVYVLNARKRIPRLQGDSRVVYVGKTIYTMRERYGKRVVRADTQNYWKRYNHIISNYGPITIDLYPCTDPDQAENDFLFAYFLEHLESPPLKYSNFKTSRLSEDQVARFYVHY